MSDFFDEPVSVSDKAERALTETVALRAKLETLRTTLPEEQVDLILDRTIFEGAPRVEVSQLLTATAFIMGDLVTAISSIPNVSASTIRALKECVEGIGNLIVDASELSGLKQAVEQLEAQTRSEDARDE